MDFESSFGNQTKQFEGVSKDISKNIRRSSKSKSSHTKINAKRIIKSIRKKIEMAELSLQTFELEFWDQLEDENNKKRLEGLQDDIKKQNGKVVEYEHKIQQQDDNQKDDSHNQKSNVHKMEREQVIHIGDDLQNRALEKVKNINLNVNDGNLDIREMNKELEAQDEKQKEIQDEVYEIGSALKRSQKLIGYFAREYYKDKCVRILSIIIILLIITIVIVSVAK